MKLTLDPAWIRKDYEPDSLTASPFAELPARPPFPKVVEAKLNGKAATGTLADFAVELLEALIDRLAELPVGKTDVLVSGGYDSRILAALLERSGIQARYITDGEEEPTCQRTLDYLGVPEHRRYVHDLSGHDPYQLLDPVAYGWAPLYFNMRFAPVDRKGRTLVCGLGGGEWFSYPATSWHTAKPRVPHDSLRNMWADTWPQYWLIPLAWADGYDELVTPYCSVGYARVANQCRQEWLYETNPRKALDAVRQAMLDELDPQLAGLGWKPHVYDWRLEPEDREAIDETFKESWLCQYFGLEFLQPSKMHDDIHACRIGGFAAWCEQELAAGNEIVVAQ